MSEEGKLVEEAAIRDSMDKPEDITNWLTAKLASGTLTVDELRSAIVKLRSDHQPRQDLLYLQVSNTSVEGNVIGMMLIEDGELDEGPPDPEDWPYKSVLAAVRDGWRIISFPNMAMSMVPPEEPQGFGFEFILERWKSQ